MSTAPVFVSARSDCCGVGIFLRLDVEAVLACLPVGSLCVQWWCVVQQPLRWTPLLGQSRGRIKRECLRTSSDAGVPEWRPGRYRSGEPEPPLSGLLPLPALTGVCIGFHVGAWRVTSRSDLGSGQGSGSSHTRLQNRPRCSNHLSQAMPYRITLTVRPGFSRLLR